MQLKEILQGSGMALGFKFLGMGASYLFTLLITRSFGASVNGLFNLAFVVLTLCTVLSRAGLDTAMLRFTASLEAGGRRAGLRMAYWRAAAVVFTLSAPVSAALYFFADGIANTWFGKPELVPYLRWFAFVVFPYAMTMVNAECLRGVRKVNAYLFYEGIGLNLFSAAFLLSLFMFGRDTDMLIRAMTGSVLLLFMASTLHWIRISGILRWGAGEKGIPLKEMLRTSLPMLTSNLLMKMMGWVDTLMLGIMRPAEDVGIYHIALKISILTKLSLAAVNSVIAPRFAAYHSQGDMTSFIRTSNYATRLIFWTSAPVLVVILAYPYTITGIFGSEFTAGVTALIILTTGQFIAAISGSVGYILNMTGHQVVQQNITLFSIVLNITLNLLLIPVMGITGAAIAAASSLAFRNLVSVYYIHRKLHFITLYLPFKGKTNS